MTHRRRLERAMNYIWVAIGGALGSVARYACAALGLRLFGPAFPWGTLFVNASGSLAIGVLAALLTTDGKPLITDGARAFLMVGVLGGFTTFSSFSLETLSLARAGAWSAAGANVIGSVAVCLVAVWLGYAAGAAWSR
jgi:CrcB protein